MNLSLTRIISYNQTYLQGATVHVSDKHGALLVHGGHEDGALRPQHDPVHLEVHSLALDCEVGELSRLKQLRLKENTNMYICKVNNLFIYITCAVV